MVARHNRWTMLLVLVIGGACASGVAAQSRRIVSKRIVAESTPVVPRVVLIPPIVRIGPQLPLAMFRREAWLPLRDSLQFERSPRIDIADRQDRDQFAGLRALRLDRGRKTRGLDAKLEFRLSGDLGGVTTDLGLGGLPRLVQRAFTR